MPRVPRWELKRVGPWVELSHSDGPERVVEVIRELCGDVDRERFVVVALNQRNRVVGCYVVSEGSISTSIVHPREVFRRAILAGAASIVVGHCHPSGEPSPSQDDREMTRRLARAGELLGIPVVDHVIVCPSGRFVSLLETESRLFAVVGPIW